jgi:hypothetical protein
MNRREFWALGGLSDDELEAGLSGLLGAGARVEARIVAHLAEVETRRLHLLAGYSSLYDYCRKRLGLSDYEAFIRIAAARVARKYPVVFEMLARRELHLTAIYEVREFLTAENHLDLFRAVSGKTKLQIREVLAQRFPQADVPASLKRLPALEPLSPGRYRLQLTLSAEQKEKLELARDLLSHANSSGDLAIVVERALDELISRLEKRRFGRAQTRPAHDCATASASTSRPAQTPEKRVATKLHTDEQTQLTGPATKLHTDEQTQLTGPGSKLRADEQTQLTGPGSKLHADEQTELAGPGSKLRAQQTDPAVPDSKLCAHEQTELAVSDRETPTLQSAPVVIDRNGDTRRRKHIANETRRDLLARDGVRCAFVGGDGLRCDARAFLQFHHRRAWARGGGDSADNLELLCSGHNRLLAERDFGRASIEAAIAARKVDDPR